MNIATCNIKTKDYGVAISACEEVLKLDPSNMMAFYRRAKATALPINAGVPDLRKAVKDLDMVIKLSKRANIQNINYVMKEKDRV